MSAFSYLTHLECTSCGRAHEAEVLHTVCTECGKVLAARYDLAAIRRAIQPGSLADRPVTLWRYHELLPVGSPDGVVSLGEGMTPLLRLPRVGAALGCPRLLVKDESLNPTGSFKARGMTVAVSRAKELGATSFAAPSAGNAGAALAAYAARAGIPAHIFLPSDAPEMIRLECAAYGARVYRVRGLISDAGRLVREYGPKRGWFDVSTLREPYRAEGKKTMGIELAEQLGWRLPDVVVYPTGGGTGIVGMWKAFDELEELGWIGPKRPRMISVQAAGCAPIVRAFVEGQRSATPWQNATTIAAGLRVPSAIGDYLILDAIRESGGTALAVDDAAILAAQRWLGETEGLFVAPEAAATLAGLETLLQEGKVDPEAEIVLFNTGAGLLYPEVGPEVTFLEPDEVFDS